MRKARLDELQAVIKITRRNINNLRYSNNTTLMAESFTTLVVAQMVKDLPAVWETWVWFLGQEDPLEKGMATLSSILDWRIPWTEEPGGLQFTGSQRSNTTE